MAAAAVGVSIAGLPAFIATLRGSPIERLLALQVASADVSLLFAILAVGPGNSFDLDLALTLALFSFIGCLAVLRVARSLR